MEFINHTPYSSLDFRTSLGEDRFAAAALLRVCYDFDPISGDTMLSESQVWPLSAEAWESAYGPVDSDWIFRKGGVDILVLGKAVSPNKVPVQELTVSVKVGTRFQQSLRVFGDRFWESGFLGLSISEAKSFSEMPLSLENSFGGKADWDGLEVPYSSNPFGKGYYLEEEEAIGKPLPNIEDPNYLIYRWDDKPEPVGFTFCPTSGLKLQGNVEHENGNITKISPKIFNQAFPKMIIDELHMGEIIEVAGCSPHGNIKVKVPKNEFSVFVEVGSKGIERDMEIDQVGILTELNQVFVTYRFPFRYKFFPMQKRECTISDKNKITISL